MNRFSGSDILSDDEEKEFKIPTKSFANPKRETHKIITRSVTSEWHRKSKKEHDCEPILTENVVYASIQSTRDGNQSGGTASKVTDAANPKNRI